MKMSDFYGKISKCWCTNSNPELPMPCSRCFCRGFVAECLHCSGTGQITEGVAGTGGLNDGKMKVSCPTCGGSKVFGVNKPADWDALHPPDDIKTAEDLALDTPPPVNDVVPQMRPGAHVSPVAASA